ncbi:MAG: glycosyltransferase family 2 protein [Planctomycetes bacterium]|nr:glycosyltransferase family 2 protein [Planctomycetota bacterium]
MANISVIIPLYNKAPYIGRTLDSVLAQTYSDFEVIVVDDGSDDNGPDIVTGCHDKRIRLIRQQNAGPGAARNHGTIMSRAPLVTYLDADDEWMPAFLNTSVKTLADNPDCDFTTAGYYIGPEKINRGRQLTNHGIPTGPWRLPLDPGREQLSYALGVFHSCSTLYKRWLIEKYGGFYTKNSCNYGEDVYLWLQIIFNHKFYRHEEPLAWYHCEASELGLSSSRKSFPLEPSLTDIEPLYRNCSLEYRPLLNRWLTIHALGAVHLNIELADMAKARHLLDAFPAIKTRRLEYLKIKVKMLFPRLIPYLRRLRTTANRLIPRQNAPCKDFDNG